MKEHHAKTWFWSLSIALIIIVAASGFLIYDLNSELTSLKEQQAEDRVSQQATNQALTDEIKRQSEVLAEQIGILAVSLDENTEVLSQNIQTLDRNIRTLDDQLTGVTANFESLSTKVDEVEQTSREGIEGLKSDIANIDGDFSSFITDLYPAIVSVRTDRGQGSGFFFREDGYIATNAHVLNNANKIEVVLSDGTVLTAAFVGWDTDHDLAVLKVSGNNYDYLRFASQSNIAVGQRVVAVGNPLGLSFSLTQGVISALDRQIQGSPVDWLQTDTPINPGNSGGPVINSNQRVVGIATAIIEGSSGLGFAIPSYQAEDILDDLASQ